MRAISFLPLCVCILVLPLLPLCSPAAVSLCCCLSVLLSRVFCPHSPCPPLFSCTSQAQRSTHPHRFFFIYVGDSGCHAEARQQHTELPTGLTHRQRSRKGEKHTERNRENECGTEWVCVLPNAHTEGKVAQHDSHTPLQSINGSHTNSTESS